MSDTTPPLKKKRGRPRKHPTPEATPDAPPVVIPEVPEAPEGFGRSAVEWAEAVMWAAEYAKRKTMPAKTNKGIKPSPMHKAYWQFGNSDDKSYTSLVVNIVPRAVAILDKAASSKTDDEMTAAEEAAVAEIDELIKAAIEEAANP